MSVILLEPPSLVVAEVKKHAHSSRVHVITRVCLPFLCQSLLVVFILLLFRQLYKGFLVFVVI